MKNIIPKKNTNRIYVVLYEQQEFFRHDTRTPVKAFKTKEIAQLYADSRNFEFQSVCILDEEDFENYVLGNQYSDYIVSVADFREVHGFVKDEILRLEKNRYPINLWDILEEVKPFKVISLEYLKDLNNV
jgi:hypothetical protein